MLHDYLLLETPQWVIDAYFIKINILLDSLIEASYTLTYDYYFVLNKYISMCITQFSDKNFANVYLFLEFHTIHTGYNTILLYTYLIE